MMLAKGRFEKGIVEECASKHRRGVGNGQPFVAVLAVAADLASRIFHQRLHQRQAASVVPASKNAGCHGSAQCPY